MTARLSSIIPPHLNLSHSFSGITLRSDHHFSPLPRQTHSLWPPRITDLRIYNSQLPAVLHFGKSARTRPSISLVWDHPLAEWHCVIPQHLCFIISSQIRDTGYNSTTTTTIQKSVSVPNLSRNNIVSRIRGPNRNLEITSERLAT